MKPTRSAFRYSGGKSMRMRDPVEVQRQFLQLLAGWIVITAWRDGLARRLCDYMTTTFTPRTL
jgi:hypothetical protein